MCRKNLLSILFVLSLAPLVRADIPQKVIKRVADATVSILVESVDGSKQIIGTGWMYQNESTIVTAAHVIDGMTEGEPVKDPILGEVMRPYAAYWIRFKDNSTVKIASLSKSNFDDVGFITVGKHVACPILKLDTKTPELGTSIFHIGFPFGSQGYDYAYASGKVSFFTKTYGENLPRIGINTAAFPGCSGSALASSTGSVLGVVVTIDERGEHFTACVPSTQVELGFSKPKIVWKQ